MQLRARAAPLQPKSQKVMRVDGLWGSRSELALRVHQQTAGSGALCRQDCSFWKTSTSHCPGAAPLIVPWLPGRCSQVGQPLGTTESLTAWGSQVQKGVFVPLLLELPALHLLCWALSRQSIHRWICPIKSMVWKDKHELPLICLFLLLVSPLPQLANLPLLFIQPSTYSTWKTPD